MWKNEDEEESDYEEGDSELFEKTFKPSYVVIAIDTHPSMFKPNKEGKLHFRSCLEACYALADSLIFTSDKRSWNPFSILLAGEQTALINFQHNMIDSIKLLKEKTQLKDSDLVKEFQRGGDLDLGSFFLTCKKLFHEIKSPFHKRLLIYLTNDDKPVTNKQTKFTALNEAKNFGGNQIDFEMIPTVENFNYKLFYNELFSLLGGPRAEEICVDTEGLTQKLTASVVMKTNQRRICFFPFPNDPKRFLKCMTVDISHSNTINYVNFTKDGKRVISAKSNLQDDNLYHFNVNDDERSKSLQFHASEREALLDYSLPKGFTLLYVSNRITDFGHMMKKPQLIKEDPSEDLPYFKKFWQSCVDTNKVLVCLSKLRQPSKVRYCELVPVLIDGAPMFFVKYLPFAHEVKHPAKQEYPDEEPSEEQTKAIQGLVDKLTFDFDIKMVPDATFQKKKAFIKAKLLDEPLEEVSDLSFDKEALESHLKEVVQEINGKFFLCGEKKRKAPVSRGQAAKKQK